MKKYIVNGYIVDEDEANEINKTNLELLEMAEKTGDMSYLLHVKMILSYDLAVELARRGVA